MSVYDSSGNLLSSQTATAYDDGILQITATAGSLYQIEVSGWNEYATEVTTSVSEPVSFISMGQGSAFVGVDPFGRIWAKGTDYDGTGTGGGDASSLQIVKDDVEFTAVSHGPRGHSLALDAAGNIWSTGDNGNGKLGIGESASTTSWTVSWQAATSGTTFVRIFAGENNSFAVDSAGDLWVAGYNPSTNGDVLDFTQTTVSDSSGPN
jgi:alpha-tubulin suppressor-like RCC1 family protein